MTVESQYKLINKIEKLCGFLTVYNVILCSRLIYISYIYISYTGIVLKFVEEINVLKTYNTTNISQRILVARYLS